uniref:Protein YIPF n=1 Tax=Cynoglossus semilaevis TaxID=244447 RepID=A0A3P8W526_CYNSE
MASPNDLQFQEFDEAADLLSADPEATTLSVSVTSTREGLPESLCYSSGFWTFEYYESLFNVDTVQVLDRVKGSVLPLPGRNFIKHYLRSNPDLYGPFWICVTLVFSVAISGNLSMFLTQMGNPAFHYRPQFHRVTIAAVIIFMYAWLVPVALWGFLTWRQSADRQVKGYSFLETVCVYGYSLFIYIPTSILWIIPFEWLRWMLILVAMVISGSVLVLTFWPAVRDEAKLIAVATVVAILLLHTLLAVGCKMYFFHSATSIPPPAAAATVSTLTTKQH